MGLALIDIVNLLVLTRNVNVVPVVIPATLFGTVTNHFNRRDCRCLRRHKVIQLVVFGEQLCGNDDIFRGKDFIVHDCFSDSNYL